MKNIDNLKFYSGAIKSLYVVYNGNLKVGIDEMFLKDGYFCVEGRDFVEVESGNTLIGRTETLDFMDCCRNYRTNKQNPNMEYCWQFLDMSSLKAVTDEDMIDELINVVESRKKTEAEIKKQKRFSFLKKLNKF